MLQLRAVRYVAAISRAIPQVKYYHTGTFDLHSSSNEQPRVLVSGSGVTGLATAIALHNRGINSQVVGSHENEPSSVYIGFNGMQILHSFSPSLYGAVKQAGQPITIMEICNEKGKPFGRVDYTSIGKKLVGGIEEITPVAITHSTLLQLLKKECQQRKIKIDGKSHLTTVVGEHESALLCRFSGGRTNELYEIVVGADGAHSKLRDDFFREKEYGMKKRFCGFVWLTAMTDRPFMFNSNILSELWGDEKRLIGIPLDNEKVQLYGAYLSEYPLHLQVEGAKGADEFVKRFPLFGSFAPHVSYALENAKQQCHLHVPQEIRLDKYSNGRIVLVGNAAHTLAPNIHMGETLAIEDAAVLAHTLSLSDPKYTSIEQRLEVYSSLRVPRVRALMEESNRISKIGHRRKLGQILFTPWSVRSGKLVRRENDFVQREFSLPSSPSPSPSPSSSPPSSPSPSSPQK